MDEKKAKTDWLQSAVDLKKALTDPTMIVDYGDIKKIGGSLSWRNNNPGNLVDGPFAKRHGAIGVNSGFAVFPTEEDGAAAQQALLAGPTFKDLTVADSIKGKYAPEIAGNDPEKYLKFLVGQGIDINAKVGDQVDKLAEAISRFEGWKEGRVAVKTNEGVKNE